MKRKASALQNRRPMLGGPPIGLGPQQARLIDPAARPMTAAEIIRFFEQTRLRELASFRALCNALKAIVIEAAVAAWRLQGRGRMTVLDLGCGRGGDLRKWAGYRLKSYHGLDGSAPAIAEAKSRQETLVAQGKSSVAADFHVVELTTQAVPLPSGSVDVISCMFFLQFAFATVTTARHVIAEVARVLRPGGVFCAILPDGDRVAQTLRGNSCLLPFGHFKLRRLYEEERLAAAAPPVGLAYDFMLSEQACTEYLVSEHYLRALLQDHGLELSANEAAQQVFQQRGDSEAAALVLKDQRCSHVDWLSLGLFTVITARKREMVA